MRDTRQRFEGPLWDLWIGGLCSELATRQGAKTKVPGRLRRLDVGRDIGSTAGDHLGPEAQAITI